MIVLKIRIWGYKLDKKKGWVMMEVMKKRSEIPEYLKWDISSLYQTESDYVRDLKKCEQMSVDIEKKYKNKNCVAGYSNLCNQRI